MIFESPTFLRGRLLLTACLSLPAAVPAAVYYVDSTTDSGDYDGTAAQPVSGTNVGPWKTIAQVNRAVLLPGDKVLFRCGRVWNEQINVWSSGTEASPIEFASYGQNCATDKPLIDTGAVVAGWQPWQGNIWYADVALPKSQPNRVQNGTFDFGPVGDGWRSSYPQSNTQSFATLPDCGHTGGCLELIAAPDSQSLFHAINIPVETGKSYEVQFDYKTTLPSLAFVVWVRGNGSPNFQQLGFQHNFQATTTWQSARATFPANQSRADGRLDFDLPAGGQLLIDNVRLTRISPETKPITQVFVDGESMPLAQFPNPGWSETSASSPFLRFATSAGVVDSTTGSDHFVVRQDDFYTADGGVAQTHAGDFVGSGVHTRTNSWLIDDRIVASFDAATSTIRPDAPTTRELVMNWGYYFDNKLWMLDRPGEWYYDQNDKRLYLWMPNGGHPDGRVVAGSKEYGILAAHRSNIRIRGLSIRHADVGVNLDKSAGFEVDRLDISDSHVAGITAFASQQGVINKNVISRSGRNGIWTVRNKAIGPVTSSDMIITWNTVVDTGTLPPGAPKSSEAAIRAGANSHIKDNIVRNSGYIGIRADADSVIKRNAVVNSCALLDDCGAIYTAKPDNNSEITDNLVLHSIGNPDGMPEGSNRSAKGIYLDDAAQGVYVARNTVHDADYGLHLHNAGSNLIEDNTLHMNRLHSIWMQESVLGHAGDVQGNRFNLNRLHQSPSTPYVHMTSVYDWNGFATFDRNRYSMLYKGPVASESFGVTGSRTNNYFTYPAWIAPGSRESTATAFDSFAIANFRDLDVQGINQVPNGEFHNSVNGWSVTDGTNTAVLGHVPSCHTSGCLALTASPSVVYTRLSSSGFVVHPERIYAVQLDVYAEFAGQPFELLLNRLDNGATAGLASRSTTGDGWQTYSFLFAAADTQDASGTGYDARLNLKIFPGQYLRIDNVSVKEVSAQARNPGDDSVLLYNDGYTDRAIGCTEAGIAAEQCSDYVDFADGSAVSWPVHVAPFTSKILVWAASPYKDSDLDGIADIDDHCGATPAWTPVDVQGCSFAQQYPGS